MTDNDDNWNYNWLVHVLRDSDIHEEILECDHNADLHADLDEGLPNSKLMSVYELNNELGLYFLTISE